jgi:acyl-CoA synthetase (AMP-forming)/AMP-acid ligase II
MGLPPADSHLIQVIGARARQQRDETAISFIHDTSGIPSGLTWGEVESQAWRARRAFKARGLAPGDRVALSLPTGEPYLAALLGALWGGLVPTTLPALPASAKGGAVEHEWRSLIETFQPAIMVSDRAPPGLDVALLAPEALLSADDEVPDRPDYDDLRSLAYIQFTSGSTGRPKGLALHWPAIRANMIAIAQATPVVPEDRVVSWLPMYHDMGLFGSLLTALYVGCHAIHMDSSLFAVNPLLWLRAVQDSRATITVTPPSALQACIDLLRRRARPDLDLSSLRKIVCGSEPVSRRFVESYDEVLTAVHGSPASALKPVYGLAEATLAVSFPPHGRPARVDRIARDDFETGGLARPVDPQDPDARDWVSAGKPVPGMEVRILDDRDRPLPERRVGRILIRSPSLVSAVLEDGVLYPREGEWLDTGDLGYLAEGEVFVTGRRKDLIIKYGRNYAPEHIEELVCLSEGVRRAVAFGVFDDAKLTERIVVVVEARAGDLARADRRDRVRLAVRGLLQSAGFLVDEILFAGKNSLPRTTSGKIRRQRCRELYLSEGLEAA